MQYGLLNAIWIVFSRMDNKLIITFKRVNYEVNTLMIEDQKCWF